MTQGPILVTGASGLIGSVLCDALADAGETVRAFDLRAWGAAKGDVRDADALRDAVYGCRGVVHLAAVSRVLAAERAPEQCWNTNVGGLVNLLGALRSQSSPPWLVSASSREVYGNQARLPVAEDAMLQPINTYAHSKVVGERLVAQAAAGGLRAMTVRFSNVYGRSNDYPDRVVPAFVRAALQREPLQVHGGHQRFDFTQVDDVVRGVVQLVAKLDSNTTLPPALHFVGGRALSLEQLALLIRRLCDSESPILNTRASGLHVSQFVGCGRLARDWLGWSAQTSVEAGISALAQDFSQAVQVHA